LGNDAPAWPFAGLGFGIFMIATYMAAFAFLI